MIARHLIRKAEQRQAHALRRDDRRPVGSEPLDLIRKRAQVERRAARRTAQEAAA